MLAFFIKGIPRPQLRARTFLRKGAKFATTWSPKTDWFHICYSVAMQNSPKIPLDGPLGVKLEFALPRPKSAGKRVFYPAVRPDLDNYAKAVMDAFTQAGVWKDDGLICVLNVSKVYAMEKTGCMVNISPLEPPYETR